jgi:hypothetical protein
MARTGEIIILRFATLMQRRGLSLSFREAKVNDRTDANICGRHIGTHIGWDQHDTFALIFYKLEPTEQALAAGLVPGDVSFDLDDGLIKQYNAKGNVTYVADLVQVLSKLPPQVEIKP